MGITGFNLHLDKMDNWICEDDLEMFWEKNCLILRPNITTCIDDISRARLFQEKDSLVKALKEHSEAQSHPNGQRHFDYEYNHFGKLFLGECVEVDGHKFCPPEEPVIAA